MRARRTKAIALGAAVLVALSMGPQAQADDHDPVIPSQEEVEAAEQRVSDAERSVGDIQAELFAANDRLEQLGVEAQVASERYNGAILAWKEARTDAREAQRRAERAAGRVESTRADLAGFVLADYTTTTDLTTFSTALGENGPDQLLDQYSAFNTSSHALDARYQAWQAASQLAEVYAQDAADALDAASDAKADAADARADAEAAVQAQEDAVVSIGLQRDQLLQELAEAQDISVALATQRQEGLEQRRQERLAEQRRQELLEQQQAEEREQRRIERQQRQDQREDRQQRREDRQQRREDRQQRREDRQQQPEPDPQPAPQPQPEPQPPAPPQTDPNPSGNASDAIAFAYNQLGEPYVWGAAGPDAWDCSGLTMGAWQAAGVYLPHYSVAQYYATTPVSYSNLRPGDLIFWASNSSNPDTIFHVGLYIGNGQMIHAPRTGRDVEVQDVWYWEAPDFFGRP